MAEEMELEEKAKAYREFIDKGLREPAVWAFQHEGVFYCPFGKPDCVLSLQRRAITRNWYSSADDHKTTTLEYFVCGIKQQEQG